MQPSCYLLQSSDSRASLYLGEVTTEEVLGVFPPASPVSISEFGANVGDHGWFDEPRLPRFDAISAFLEFLHTRQDLDLIDFSADVGRCRLSTHDDGEAKIVFPSQSEALSFLHRALPRDAADAVIAELLKNQGFYVTNRSGTFRAFETFDEYLAGA